MNKVIGDFVDKIYTVITLSLADVEQLDEDEANQVPYFEKIYTSLTEDDKLWLADYISEWLYAHDQYQDALKTGLNKLMLEKAK